MAIIQTEPIISRPNHGCKRFKDKQILVAAGSLGIGRAIVERLCQEGASVFICSRNCMKGGERDKLFKRISGTIANVGQTDDLNRFVEEGLQFFGNSRIDGAVCNAGVNPVAEPTLNATEELYNKIFQVNVKSCWELVKAVRPYLGKNASIVFISSVGGFQPSPPAGLYGISKTAVASLARVLAQDLGIEGIRVNTIAPGLVKTRMSEFFWKGEANKDMKRAQIERTFLKRLGEPENIAGITAFLLSEDASYVTGEAILATGGMPTRL